VLLIKLKGKGTYMKKALQSLSLLTAFGLIVMSFGCASTTSVVPGRGLPLEALGTTATYDVIGSTTGSASGTILFGVIKLPFGPRKIGVINTGVPTLALCPIKNAAAYNAIEAMPGADSLIAPRWVIETTDNWGVYKKIKATVKAKAIRYNTSAK